CSQGCRFCQAGMVFRPVRERSAERICQLALRSLRETGYEEISLFSLNTTDYSCLEGLLPSLMGHLEKGKISLSFPSLRTDGLSLSLLNQIKRVRKTGLTLAPEAGSQRLRDVINKGLDEESILGAARAAGSAGWEGMKLYFMMGLPSEREEDLLEIARLSKEAQRAGRAERKGNFHLTVSVSSFIPKPHTPFQWVGQAPLEELREKLSLLRDRIRGPQLSLKWQSPEMSFLEATFSRGDQSLGQALWKAQALGCRFDGWTEQLRFDLWTEAFIRSGIDATSYANRQVDPGETLPWDAIGVGLSREFLRREYEKAKAGEISPDCRIAGCQGCGLDCPPRASSVAPVPSPINPARCSTPAPASERIRIRFRFRKGERARFLSHLEIMRTLARAARRAGIPLSYSQGFHPQPRLRIAWALPVGVCGDAEWGEIELERRWPPSEIEEGLNRALPPGLELWGAEEVPSSSPPLERSLSRASYQISVSEEGISELASRAPLLLSAAFMQEPTLLTDIQRKGRQMRIDLRPWILEFRLEEGEGLPCWHLLLRLSPEGGVHPSQVMARFCSIYLDEKEAHELVLSWKIRRKDLS
ncbi:MAG: TIGR03936 family radical SAM-associated protein, partial [candidate division NC10 bacterium]|nr:TIGR03936 family radical SAM-associated protein [candidate division NC10 bacterium]